MAYYDPTFDRTSFLYRYDSSLNNLSVVANVTIDVKPRESLQAKPAFDPALKTAKRTLSVNAGTSTIDPVVILDKTPVVVIPKVDVPYDKTKPDEFKKALRAYYQLGYTIEAIVLKADGTTGGQKTDSIGSNANIEIS